MGMIRFIPVSQITDPLTVTLGLSGASGTGKTYTALRVARGMAEATAGKGAPIGYVDTENRRALHYRAAFPEMCHFDFTALDDSGKVIGFAPERWMAALDAAEAAGLPVVILDSFSAAWEGVGGVLDLHAQALDRLTRGDDSKKDARSQLAWAEVKPRYRRLIDRIVRANTNIIICTRAKPVMQDFKTKQNARPTKTRRADVPWDVAGDGDLMYEMTAMMMLDPAAPGCPVHQIKCADQFRSLFDPSRPMSEDTGRIMAEWAKNQDAGQREKQAMDKARDIARQGSAAFREWWAGDGKAVRAMVKPIIEELQGIAQRADQDAQAQDSDEPFANAPQESAGPPDAEASAEPDAEEVEAAYQRGRTAAQQGRTAESCPAALKAVPQLQAAWERGWKDEDAAA